MFGLEEGGPYTVARDRKSFEVEGYFIEMAKILSTKLNFKIKYNLWNEKEFNIHRDDYLLSLLMLIHVHRVRDVLKYPVVVTSGFIFVVPPGMPYTPLEKFLLPFDDLTWILILLWFGVAFTVVILIRLTKSSSINEWIVGSNVRHPALNVFGVLMGSCMKVLPKTNVARFMLMNLILFCLIMRTAYQGKYFEFLTSNPTKKPMTTFEDIAASNFSIYHDQENFYLNNYDFDFP